jgi:hypothetical protein
MKKFLLPAISAIFCLFSQAQFQGNISYNMSVPLKEMADNINLTHSMFFDMRYKFNNSPLWLGSQFGIGTYAETTERQTYTFSSGETTEADVRFSSNVMNLHMVAGIDLVSKGSVIPYVNIKGGYSQFFTCIYIPDPSDDGGCKALENKNVFKDGAWSTGAGAGIKIPLNKLVKDKFGFNTWIDFSAGYLVGGEISYINAKKLMNDDPNSNPKPFNVTFVHVATNELHQHKVAEVFTSRINQLDLKLGILFKL